MANSKALGLFLVFCVAFQAVAALKGEVVAYWGQSSSSSEKALKSYCQDSTYDIIVIGFINYFPISEDGDSYPGMNLAGHCNDEYPGHENLLSCPDVASDIQYCQSRGKKIFISMGGADGDYGFSSNTQAQNFATLMWNTFFGGSGSVRPFGNAILDGVDLDIESGTTTGYASFINKLRTYYATGSKAYYISGAPQCLYPDEWLGPQSGTALTDGWFDYVFVQFYNNNCGVNYYPKRFNYDSWATWARTISKNSNVKVVIGAPASASAAGEGYVNAATLQTIATDVYSKYPTIFGGIMLWDVGTAAANNNFGAQLAAFLHTSASSSSSSSSSTSSSTSTSKSSTSTSTSKSSTSTSTSTSSKGSTSTSTSSKGSTSTSSKGSTSTSTGKTNGGGAVPAPTVAPASGACTDGYMKCASSSSYQACAHGNWAAVQKCQSGLTCTPVGTYIYCT